MSAAYADWLAIMRTTNARRERVLKRLYGVSAYPAELIALAAEDAFAAGSVRGAIDAAHDVLAAWEQQQRPIGI